MKNVRVRLTGDNGHPTQPPEGHLTASELLVALESFGAEATPLARRGRWILHEADLALRRIKGRRARLRRQATLLNESADRLESAARRRRPAKKAR